jgi:uncharacterized membrane protein
MPGKKATIGDWFAVIAIVLPIALLVGAALGYYGAPSSIRVPLIVTFVSAAGWFARKFVSRRVKALNTA